MTLAILQARTSSRRLPGKVLKPILGVPMLLRQVERLHRSKYIDRLVIATSADVSDDPIATLAAENNIACYRGDLNDVLSRYYFAAIKYGDDHIVRLTGDCPLADPELIDQVIRFYFDGNYEYVTNAIHATFPDGLDVEVFRIDCLTEAWSKAVQPSQREHVTPYIYQNADRFRIGHYQQVTDLSHLRWTVDEPSDFEFVSKVYESLYPVNPAFSTEDVLKLIARNPLLQQINTQIRRNEGYVKSLMQDNAIGVHQ